jgi:hypothetical protein
MVWLDWFNALPGFSDLYLLINLFFEFENANDLLMHNKLFHLQKHTK